MVVIGTAPEPPGEDKPANLSTIRRLVSAARAQGSELVVSPSTRYSPSP
jgi:predicted amidohydrolase